MKFPFPVYCLAAVAWSQASGEEAPLPSTRLNSPIVIGEFVPPQPLPPKAIPLMRIEGAVTREMFGKRVTVIRGAPSTLPDIPREPAHDLLSAEETARRKELLARHPKPVFLHIGATVYDHQVSVVHWRHPTFPTVAYQAEVGFDFGIFANVGKFTHKNLPHNLLMMQSNVRTAALRRWRGDPPEIPSVAPEASRITIGDATDAVGMSPFTALMDLYFAEREALLAANAARLEYLRDAEEWRKANPPPDPPSQRTFWLLPHRGSRYLQQEGGAR